MHYESRRFSKNQGISILNSKSSVIRQKGESQNGCFKKTKHTKSSEKRKLFTPWYAHVSTSFCFITVEMLPAGIVDLISL